MKSAIALTPIWNHYTKTIVQVGETFTMPEFEVNSLIAIEAAQEIEPEEA